MHFRTNTIDHPDIPTVLENRGCLPHGVHRGEPCWQIYQSNGNILGAICNRRARLAGFTGKISPESLSGRFGAKTFKKKQG